MANNIIRFPVERRIAQSTLTDKELRAIDLEACYALADNYSEEITSDILAFLHDEGMKIDGSTNVNDISMVFESIRSMLLKHHSIYHPIQVFVDSMYERSQEASHNPHQLEFDFD